MMRSKNDDGKCSTWDRCSVTCCFGKALAHSSVYFLYTLRSLGPQSPIVLHFARSSGVFGRCISLLMKLAQVSTTLTHKGSELYRSPSRAIMREKFSWYFGSQGTGIVTAAPKLGRCGFRIWVSKDCAPCWYTNGGASTPGLIPSSYFMPIRRRTATALSIELKSGLPGSFSISFHPVARQTPERCGFPRTAASKAAGSAAASEIFWVTHRPVRSDGPETARTGR